MSESTQTAAEILSEMRSVAMIHDANNRLAIDHIEHLANLSIENAEATKATIAAIRERGGDTSAPWPPRDRAPVEPTAERAAVIEVLDEVVARMKGANFLSLQSRPLRLEGFTVYISVIDLSRLKPPPKPNQDSPE